MQTTIIPFTHASDGDRKQLAQVVSVADGNARYVRFEGGMECVAVVAHASHVPALNKGDTVIVERVSNQWIVLARLRRTEEMALARLSHDNGKLVIEAQGAVELRVGQNVIALTGDGVIHVDGARVGDRATDAVATSDNVIAIN
jgi:hypothetical protein